MKNVNKPVTSHVSKLKSKIIAFLSLCTIIEQVCIITVILNFTQMLHTELKGLLNASNNYSDTMSQRAT